MSLDIFTRLLEAAFAWTWRTSLHATVLIALVFLILIVFRKWLTPAWRYALWLLVVVRLSLPVVPTSPFSIFNLAASTRNPASSAFLPATQPISVADADRDWLPITAAPKNASPFEAIQLRVGADSALSAGATGVLKGLSLRSLVGWGWLAGAAGFLLLIFLQHTKVSALVRNGHVIADDRVQSLLASCQAMLGVRRRIDVIETSHLSTPAVFGFRRPRLLLPASLRHTLDDRELRLIFLHELTHIKRGDVLLNWLLILVQALHWFNPLVWLAFKRLRAERELVCDAQVLRRLEPHEHRHYGDTLIKLVEQFSPTRLSPGLVPVINHQTEVKRRIIMIAQFKPTSRLVVIVSAILVLTLIGFTFTRAAEKAPGPQVAQKPQTEPTPDKRSENIERGINILEGEYAMADARVREKQKELDALKRELNISKLDEALYGPLGDFDPETLRKIHIQCIEAAARYEGINALYTNLARLPRAEFRKAIPTAAPDPQLASLMEKMVEANLRLATASADFSDKNPEVMRVRGIVKILEKEIEDRLDGILVGLETRAVAQKAELDALQRAVGDAKRTDFQKDMNRRHYFVGKADLESLKMVRERIGLRITQEKIDAAIERKK